MAVEADALDELVPLGESRKRGGDLGMGREAAVVVRLGVPDSRKRAQRRHREHKHKHRGREPHL